MEYGLGNLFTYRKIIVLALSSPQYVFLEGCAQKSTRGKSVVRYRQNLKNAFFKTYILGGKIKRQYANGKMKKATKNSHYENTLTQIILMGSNEKN